ncbi:hypothetical protein DYE48_11350 [Halobacillus trueperi]|uniref:Uncharacterized protein n=1 Tax=Halobacillus trueperi TaxID=156205 RepID=A0A3E0J7V9_9BACI|nr:hypothetical protein DYE48_11350 [Halobacillus trueperi]
MHGETPQDAVRGGSPRSRGKRAIPRSPYPLNKSLETESSRNGSLYRKKAVPGREQLFSRRRRGLR